MASRHRPPSPPYGRRFVPPERTSTGSFAAPGYSSYDSLHDRTRRDSYNSPRGSNERVIPVSTETYRDGSLVSSSGPPTSDTSSTRRSTVTNPSTAPTSSALRTNPTVIHQSGENTHTTGRHSGRYSRNGDFYVTPSNSAADPGHHHQHRHRRRYSKDDDQHPSGGSRERNEAADYDQGRRRGEQRYHLTGPSNRPASIDEEGGYEYATPREVFENTEPRWRPARRGSADAPNRERPTSLIESMGRPNRPVVKESGPPPATRALERLGNGAVPSRHDSLREPLRSPPRNRDRERTGHAYNSEDDDYYVPPRSHRPRENSVTNERHPPYSPTRGGAVDDRRDSLRPSRRYEDTDVVNRGFGIRAASVEPPRASDENVSSRARYPDDQPILPPDFSTDSRRMETRRRDHEAKAPPADRDSDTSRKRDRDPPPYDRPRDIEPSESSRPHREHNYPQPPDRDRYIPPEYKNRDPPSEQGSDASKRGERPQTDRRHKDEASSKTSTALATAGIAGVAAAAATAKEAPRRGGSPEQEPSKQRDVKEPAPENARTEQRPVTPDEIPPRERHYVTRDENREESRNEASAPAIDPDEEYRLRVQQELGRAKRTKPESGNDHSDSPSRQAPPSRTARDDDDLETDSDTSNGSRTLAIRNDNAEKILDEPLTDEPAVVVESRESRVRIVEPPREKDKPKGILRKPTAKFPEDPNPVREGVAPHKDDKRDIPQGTKWTKISRTVVNPQALEEAGERFEERRDFVIVLRAITREQVQKLADRTEEIRKEREQRPHHHRRHKKDESKRNRDDEVDDEDDNEEDEEEEEEEEEKNQH